MKSDTIREIKFRGRQAKGGWLYGNLVDSFLFRSILSVEFVRTSPIDLIGSEIIRTVVSDYTIGQYTGLKDNNGKEIYEGDIVSTELPFSDEGFRYRCEYDERTGAFKFYSLQSSFGGYLYWCDMGDVEVIGNIYDNKDLLKEGI